MDSKHMDSSIHRSPWNYRAGWYGPLGSKENCAPLFSRAESMCICLQPLWGSEWAFCKKNLEVTFFACKACSEAWRGYGRMYVVSARLRRPARSAWSPAMVWCGGWGWLQNHRFKFLQFSLSTRVLGIESLQIIKACLYVRQWQLIKSCISASPN